MRSTDILGGEGFAVFVGLSGGVVPVVVVVGGGGDASGEGGSSVGVGVGSGIGVHGGACARASVGDFVLVLSRAVLWWSSAVYLFVIIFVSRKMEILIAPSLLAINFDRTGLQLRTDHPSRYATGRVVQVNTVNVTDEQRATQSVQVAKRVIVSAGANVSAREAAH